MQRQTSRRRCLVQWWNLARGHEIRKKNSHVPGILNLAIDGGTLNKTPQLWSIIWSLLRTIKMRSRRYSPSEGVVEEAPNYLTCAATYSRVIISSYIAFSTQVRNIFILTSGENSGKDGCMKTEKNKLMLLSIRFVCDVHCEIAKDSSSLNIK